ncbi:TioE family transcriptional regulator [Bacillus gaemokensis]|uniref:Transcriptional regulator n=1 Tax=Bacillus gaemokensis TaxID=574375 RepID=A0A073KMB1_9BACI|nr:TioE family transcriptional regulator [Bacillus gaemokensis]KEK23463.1 transcriptional regulator [Bacillus gaemokensis]KYG27169.1 transcriptional regulator [Bacillus gaemokensis]
MHYYKPIEIAKELQISTSALRHYESSGVIPSPERSETGYRLYTKLHLAYFRCLRAMVPSFGYTVTYNVLRHIQNKDIDNAFWIVNAEQAKLQHEKRLADQTLLLLQDKNLTVMKDKKLKHTMTIGEIAALTDVQTSAIRHWEKEGLLSPKRNLENGYRLYTPIHVKQILLIRTLRKTGYFLDQMKEIIQAVENQSIEKAKKVTESALLSIHQRNRQQYNGVHKLVELCNKAELMDYNDTSLLKPNHSFDQTRENTHE